MKISDYAAPSKGGIRVEEDDNYPATIISVAVNMDKDNPRLPAINEWDKNSLRVVVHLDDRDDAGDPIEIARNMNISYGAAGGVYAPLAKLIEAALGIKCGDKRQREVTTEELQGKRLRVQTKNVEGRSGGTFTNIVDFLPSKKMGATVRAAASIEPDLPDADLDADLPF